MNRVSNRERLLKAIATCEEMRPAYVKYLEAVQIIEEELLQEKTDLFTEEIPWHSEAN